MTKKTEPKLDTKQKKELLKAKDRLVSKKGIKTK